MAGKPLTAQRLRDAEDEIARLRRELEKAGRTAVPSIEETYKPRTYDERIPAELLAWSDDGLHLSECWARWCIGADTWEEWKGSHDLLRNLEQVARARGRAAVMAAMRSALAGRQAIPAGVVDRMLKLFDDDGPAGRDDATRLISAQLTATQRVEVRCSCCTGACQTEGQSDAVSGEPFGPADA